MITKSKSNKKFDVQPYRRMLEQRRNELIAGIQDYQDYTKSGPGPGLGGATGDVGDHALSDYSNELFGVLLEKQAGSLEEVECALAKIETGDYGLCASCHKKISAKRLKALPWAKLCRTCQEREDRTGAMRLHTGRHVG